LLLQMLRTQEYPGLLIAVARQRIKQAVLTRAARHGLSVQQFWLLVALHERGGASQGELAERMRVDAPTASRVIAVLARRRLVRVEQDPDDRRRARLHLTRTGGEMARELVSVAGEIRSAVVDGMTAAEIACLRSGLRRVISNMERLDARAAREAS
jgi:DNA-binding MarR family transcriptional regulator